MIITGSGLVHHVVGIAANVVNIVQAAGGQEISGLIRV